MKSKWNERYQGQTFFYGQEANDFLKDSARLIKARGNVLCLAEGEGRNAIFLAKLGFHVTAIDQSDIGLEKLRVWASNEGLIIKTIVADLENYKIEENAWDAIISIWCHLPSVLRKKVHSQSVLGLKANGLFILEAYIPLQLDYKTGGPSDVDFLVTTKLLIEELLGLNCTNIMETLREIHEGAGHNGMSAVVQCIAKKDLK